MTARPDILCIGSVLWDVIGRTRATMRLGADVPGRISRIPGGVALNIAMTLAQFGLRPALLSVLGRDSEGDELAKAAEAMGLITDHLLRSESLPTDTYMAVEGANGLIAAIADANSLEAAGARILDPLHDGRLASAEAPWTSPVALDGNLTLALLRDIAASPLFASADLRVAPASPGKAERLLALLGHPTATFYVNIEEAGILCHTTFEDSEAAARALVDAGVARALVTDGAGSACDATPRRWITREPPQVEVTRVTGAGDTFMAAHIAAEHRHEEPVAALETALAAAASYVAGKTRP
jgi:sugar/nucleoside kinase (ribokinase family)